MVCRRFLVFPNFQQSINPVHCTDAGLTLFSMKKLLLLNFLLLGFTCAHAQATREVTSPNGTIRLVAYVHDQLRYSVYFKNRLIVSPSEIDLALADGKKLSGGLSRPQFTERIVSETIISPVPEKRTRIPDRYKELKITLRNAFAVIFRVYDDGVAYRIATYFQATLRFAPKRPHSVSRPITRCTFRKCPRLPTWIFTIPVSKSRTRSDRLKVFLPKASFSRLFSSRRVILLK
jgi:hypothetical protein